MAEALGFSNEELQGKRLWTRKEMLQLRDNLRSGMSKAEAVDRVLNPRDETMPPGMA